MTATLMYSVRVFTPFQIGTGDGAETSFSGTLPGAPIEQPSLVVFSEIASTEVRAYDDNAGTISGSSITGTVNYTTGVVSVVFPSPPDDGAGVYVEYTTA